MADNIRPWYRWHVNRWRNSPRVLSMSLAAQGAYRNLLDAAWNNGAKLPNNPDVLWRFALASSSAEFARIAPQIMPMFTVSDDGKWLLNETLTSEWNDATEWFKKKSAAGKLGADARWSQSTDMPVPSQSHGDAITVPMANDGTSPHHTLPNNTIKPSSPKPRRTDIFSKAYDCYPRRVGRRAAEKAWNGAVGRRKHGKSPEETEAFLFDRVMTYGAACQTACKDQQFIPHMATWLNQDRFLDNPDEWLATGKNGHKVKVQAAADNSAADDELRRQGVL